VRLDDPLGGIQIVAGMAVHADRRRGHQQAHHAVAERSCAHGDHDDRRAENFTQRTPCPVVGAAVQGVIAVERDQHDARGVAQREQQK